ncbi:hypothetical protein [Idiomarina xiamenensis]|uniref:Uncharacterized protein n=1 Tax=Idiomarina xiamenensis 10-D-4 TaxID=740709 RepID=K2K9D7_9GAMM|nr:hypothetical protein [Idiomarina xiamenensis]EKE84403.1 hypothetical protein A10D4_05027 [Idiomarina xiamenensis 10-D-4]
MTEQQHQHSQATTADNVAEDPVQASEALLQQALSMFDMQSVAPVQAAFPQVINGDQPLQAVASNADHDVWLQSLIPASDANDTTNTTAEQDPLQAIRAMYGE